MICEVYQVNDNPDHLLLVAQNGEVINGAWFIQGAESYGLKIELLGHINYGWDSEFKHEDYNMALERFQNGDRADPLEKCPCCGKLKYE